MSVRSERLWLRIVAASQRKLSNSVSQKLLESTDFEGRLREGYWTGVGSFRRLAAHHPEKGALVRSHHIRKLGG